MITELLKENVLTDDLLHLAENGKVFKGGYFAFIEYYTFLNAWSDKKHIIRFRKEKSLAKYLKTNYNEYYSTNYSINY